MVIKKKQLIEKTYMVFLLLMGLFQGFVGMNGLWNAMTILLTGMLFLSSNRIRRSVKRYPIPIILIILFVTLIIINLVFTGATTYFSYNFIQLFRPMLILVTVFYVGREDDSCMIGLLDKMHLFVNLMWLINLFVLALQVAGTGFLVKSGGNTFYFDNCTGLFGNSATHVLTMFTSFFAVHNIDFAKRCYRGTKKHLSYAYTFVTLGVMLFFSTQNDNNSMFLVLPLVVGVYLLTNLAKSNRNAFVKVVKILTAIGALYLCVQLIPFLHDMIYEKLITLIDNVLHFKKTNGLGSVERLAIVEQALANGFGFRYGQGIGTWSLIGENYAGFLHFGLSSIGAVTYLLGIWFYIFTCLSYTYLLSNNTKKADRITFLLSMAIIVLLSIYTMYFTYTNIVIWSLFAFLTINRVECQ